MRKRTINHLADTIFWYLLYFLPVIAYLLYMLVEPGAGTTAVLSIEEFFNSIGLGFVSDNVVLTALSSIFGADGVLPLFSTNTPFLILTWFVAVYIAHLAVDFILFIPRLAHKFMNSFTREE